ILGGAIYLVKTGKLAPPINVVVEEKVQPVIDISGIQGSVNDLSSQFSNINRQVIDMPSQVLKSITGSSNTYKGKLGELIAFIQLKAEYDRIIPLGNIVDFIGIDFGTKDKPGKIVFIDIKTGKNARLSADQKAIKKIIEAGNIHFSKFDIAEIDVMQAEDEQ